MPPSFCDVHMYVHFSGIILFQTSLKLLCISSFKQYLFFNKFSLLMVYRKCLLQQKALGYFSRCLMCTIIQNVSYLTSAQTTLFSIVTRLSSYKMLFQHLAKLNNIFPKLQRLNRFLHISNIGK